MNLPTTGICHFLVHTTVLQYTQQCGGSGSVESISFPWIRIRIKKLLDPESGSVSNYTDPDPTKTIENIK